MSKEVTPVGLGDDPNPRIAADFLLAQMRQADIRRAFMVIREGKWDIPARLGDGEHAGVALAYLVTRPTAGVPYTLDRAYPHIQTDIIALGFPDLMVRDRHALHRLLQAYARRPADVLLGLLPLGDPQTMDAVELHDRRVTRIWPKTGDSAMQHTWAFAVWRPRFTGFMHDFLANGASTAPPGVELQVGDIFQAAIAAGLSVEGERIGERTFVDLGTPAGLAEAARRTDAPSKDE